MPGQGEDQDLGQGFKCLLCEAHPDPPSRSLLPLSEPPCPPSMTPQSSPSACPWRVPIRLRPAQLPLQTGDGQLSLLDDKLRPHPQSCPRLPLSLLPTPPCLQGSAAYRLGWSSKVSMAGRRGRGERLPSGPDSSQQFPLPGTVVRAVPGPHKDALVCGPVEELWGQRSELCLLGRHCRLPRPPPPDLQTRRGQGS